MRSPAHSLLALTIAMMLSPLCYGVDTKAEATGISMDQIVDHLELKGENWDVEFDEPVWLTYIITDTSGHNAPIMYWTSQEAGTHFEYGYLDEPNGADGFSAIKRSIVLKRMTFGKPIPAIGGAANEMIEPAAAARFIYPLKLDDFDGCFVRNGQMPVTIGEPIRFLQYNAKDESKYVKFEVRFTKEKPEEPNSKSE